MKTILFSIAMFASTTAAFSQNCFEVLSGTRIQQEANGTYTLLVNYNTTGNKALGVVVKCGSSVILDTCFVKNGNGTETFSNLFCPTGNISAVLTPHPGSCNAQACPNYPTLYGPTGSVLPVKLNGFSAIRFKQEVSLNWNTEFETGTKEFIVERAEATEFRSVGSILANGNSSTKKSYSFNDKNQNAGVTYYRLKNIDLNGKYTYSDIQTVKGYGAANDVTVFPNPARSNSNISLVGVAANSSIQLLDFSGKILKIVNSNTMNSFNLTDIKNGTYLIRIIDKATNEVINRKLSVSN